MENNNSKSKIKSTQSSFKEFMTKIETARKSGGVDLTTTEDLSLAVMNLISLEEHFYFTSMKTGKDEYLDTSAEIRNMRKGLLEELMPEHEGETWCASKHLLSTTMRLIEVGNKLQSSGKKENAKKMFERAYRVYSIFWALKLKLVGVRRNDSTSDNVDLRLDNLVSKLADCCKE